MHVALMAGSEWLYDDLTQLRRLVVGLMDEHVQVSQVLPDSVPEQQASSLCHQLFWRDTSWPLLHRFRANSLLEVLSRLGVGLIHALDGQLWRTAMRLGRKLQVPVVLSAKSSAEVARVNRLGRQVSSEHVAVLAPTEPLATAMGERLRGRVAVELVPLGVHVTTGSSVRATSSEAFCALIAGTGQVDADYEELFAALADFVADHPDSQFFLAGRDPQQHSLWQLANRYRLLANMSLAPRELGHTELLMGAHVLIQPQRLGRARGLTLQAMAGAVTVLSRADPWLDYLIHDQTAWIVESRTRKQWSALLYRAVEEPEEAKSLGEQAQQWVRQRHLVSYHIARTLDVYRRLHGESIKFPH